MSVETGSHGAVGNGGPLLLSAEQVAELLSVPVGTVRYAHRVGRLRAVRCGRFNRFTRQAVADFVSKLGADGAR